MFSQMDPVNIIINNTKIQLGGQLPDTIRSLEVQLNMNVRFDQQTIVNVKSWLNIIMERLDCEFVEYNKVLIPVNELKKF